MLVVVLSSALLLGGAAFSVTESLGVQAWLRWLAGVATILVACVGLFVLVLAETVSACTS